MMNLARSRLILALLAISNLVSAAAGQRPVATTPGAGPRGPAVKPIDSLPQDEKIKDLYLAFVHDAERIARDYERQNKPDQARAVYQEILKLFPNYPPAKKKLDEFQEKELTADKKTVEVSANKAWQDTGITVIPGKPLKFTATGSWTVKVSQQVGPDGLPLRDFNLGSLVGVVMPPRNPKEKEPPKLTPFRIGPSQEYTAGQSGQLMLRMYDAEPDDNSGKIRVEIQGTFERK
ncbi:MAG: tetratricopeptide repeat protein [Pirellulales bacterium]